MCVVQSSSCKTHGNAPEQFSRRSGLTKLQGSVSTKWLLCRTVGFNPGSQLLFSCTLSFRQLSLFFGITERLLPRWKLFYFNANHWFLLAVNMSSFVPKSVLHFSSSLLLAASPGIFISRKTHYHHTGSPRPPLLLLWGSSSWSFES